MDQKEFNVLFNVAMKEYMKAKHRVGDDDYLGSTPDPEATKENYKRSSQETGTRVTTGDETKGFEQAFEPKMFKHVKEEKAVPGDTKSYILKVDADDVLELYYFVRRFCQEMTKPYVKFKDLQDLHIDGLELLSSICPEDLRDMLERTLMENVTADKEADTAGNNVPEKETPANTQTKEVKSPTFEQDKIVDKALFDLHHTISRIISTTEELVNELPVEADDTEDMQEYKGATHELMHKMIQLRSLIEDTMNDR